MMISNGSSPRIAVDARAAIRHRTDTPLQGFPVADGLVAVVLSTNGREVNSPLFFIRRRKEHAFDSKREKAPPSPACSCFCCCFSDQNDSFALMASESEGGWTEPADDCDCIRTEIRYLLPFSSKSQ